MRGLLAPVLVIIIALVLAADCSCGRWVYYFGSITTHRYVAAHTDYDTDSDGNTISHYHAEEFHLGFASTNGVAVDMTVSSSIYNTYSDGTPVWVKARKGRLTNYLPHITEPPSPEQ